MSFFFSLAPRFHDGVFGGERRANRDVDADAEARVGFGGIHTPESAVVPSEGPPRVRDGKLRRRNHGELRVGKRTLERKRTSRVFRVRLRALRVSAPLRGEREARDFDRDRARLELDRRLGGCHLQYQR